MSEPKTVAVPTRLYEQCERKIEGTNFDSVDQYVQFILSEVVDPEETLADGHSSNNEIPEDHLKALGYLDRSDP